MRICSDYILCVCGIPWTWEPLDLLSLWDPLWDPFWDSSGIHETCVGPHVMRVDTHVGLVALGWLDCLAFTCGWLDYLFFSLVFNLACSSTEIEQRSLHLHSINSKPTFQPPQCRERTGTYSACVLGVRLRYRRHGDHVY